MAQARQPLSVGQGIEDHAETFNMARGVVVVRSLAWKPWYSAGFCLC